MKSEIELRDAPLSRNGQGFSLELNNINLQIHWTMLIQF